MNLPPARHDPLAFALGCGDLLTSTPPDGEAFDAPVEGLSTAELQAFVRGDTEFGRRFGPASGLGPTFNNVSCASCHSGDGRGRLENALRRIGTASDGFLGALGGPQIQEKAIAGAHASQCRPRRHCAATAATDSCEAHRRITEARFSRTPTCDLNGIISVARIGSRREFVPASDPGGGRRGQDRALGGRRRSQPSEQRRAYLRTWA